MQTWAVTKWPGTSGYPANGFKSLNDARQWAARFVQWYNHDHRHSGIRYVAPAQRHVGDDGAILAKRHALYQAARERNPGRWTRDTRNWTPIGAVTLNPEREARAASLRPSANSARLSDSRRNGRDNYLDTRRQHQVPATLINST